MILDEVKMALRITSDAFNTEISSIIEAAKSDLKLTGVSEIKTYDIEKDSLVKRAVILYCKSQFGLDNPDSDKYQRAYDSLKIHLVLSQEYTV
jgi:uncharacterized phage protein (predicted DNA packaging)